MSGMIARPTQSESRCFSLPGVESGDDGDNTSPDHRAARALLSLADRDWTLPQRLLGWGLDDRGRLGRLLHQHREAVDAEREGRWQRADFFWRQARLGLKALHGRQRLWRQLCRERHLEETKELATAEGLRRRLIEEVFVDTHCAFYNGRYRDTEGALPPGDRVFSHIRHLEEMLPLLEWSMAEQANFLRPAAESHIAAHEARGKRNLAIQVARDFLRTFPGDVQIQDLLIGFHIVALEAEIGEEENEHQALANAAKIQSHIRDLEALRQVTQSNLHIYQILGQLHCRRAVSLANGGRLASALGAVERSLTYNPPDPAAAVLRHNLTEAMTDLQEQMRLAQQQITYQPGAQLNADGLKLKKQADLGFSISQRFAASATATKIREGFENVKEAESNFPIQLPAPDVEPSVAFLASPAKRIWGDHEPPLEWMLSRQDPRLKIQSLAAIVLLLLAGSWSWRESQSREVRDVAYEQLLEADKAGESLALLAAAETFLSTPLHGQDKPREQKVVDIYSEGLARWAIDKRGPFSNADHQRFTRFKELVSTSHGR